MDTADLQTRWQTVSARLHAHGADAVVLTDRSDLEYLTGFPAHSWERLTAFVAHPTSTAPARLFVPQVELALAPVHDGYYDLVGWIDAQNPVALVADFLGSARKVVVSDGMWAVHLLRLKQLMPDCEFVSLSDSLGGLRSIKTSAEMLALQEAGWQAQRVVEQLQAGLIPLVGRTELEIAADISARLLVADHETVEFCIVASGPNSACAHHNPTDRVVQSDEMVLFDFGGRHRSGFCSDVTRCVWTGPIPSDVQATWDTLKMAQQAAVDAARPGARLGDVDAAARSIIADSGCGPNFVHRTGHGIGTDVHEQPYVTEGSAEIVAVGHAFSIEPGMYFDGRWGMRLEDIVVIGEAGAIRCTDADHNLISLRS